MDGVPFPAVLESARTCDSRALFDMLAGELKRLFDFAFLTVLVPDVSGSFLIRIYSTNPESYPLGPADRFVDSPWFRRLFLKGKPIVAGNRGEIARWLPDFDGFLGTKYGALVNYPVVAGGQTIGILNITAYANDLPPNCGNLIRKHLPLAVSGISVHLTAADG